MATRLPNYQMRDGRTRLGQSYFNPIWADLDSRLDTLERIKLDWQSQVAQLRDLGLQRIDDYIRPVVDEVDALLTQATEETNGLADNLVNQHISPLVEQVEQILQQAQADTDALAQTLVDEHIAPILAQAQQLRSSIDAIRQTAQQDAAAIAQALADMNWEQQLTDLEQSLNQALAAKLGKSEKAADADKLDGQNSSFYRNAGNLNTGTLPGARLPNASRTTTGGVRVRLNGTTAYITNNGSHA